MAIALRTQLAELSRRGGTEPGAGRWEDLAGARAVLPESSIPWGVAHFVGGAVLGQFPELCYDSLLRPLADRTGIAVVCTPYELSGDHEELSRSTSAAFEAALAVGAVRHGWAPDRLPRFALGHSLGAKLQVLACCRGAGSRLAGVGLLAFNNFGVEDQVRLLREALRSFQSASGAPVPDERFWDELIQPALGRVTRMSGLQFRPSPEELMDLVRQNYDAGRTRAFRFDGDALDCTNELMEALALRGAAADYSELAGGHLSPVFVSFDDVAQQAASRAPPGAAGQFAEQASQRFAGGSLGNEAELGVLLDSLVAWVRKPT